MKNEEREKLDRIRQDCLYKASDLTEMADYLEKTNFANADYAVMLLKREAKMFADKADLILKDLLGKREKE